MTVASGIPQQDTTVANRGYYKSIFAQLGGTDLFVVFWCRLYLDVKGSQGFDVKGAPVGVMIHATKCRGNPGPVRTETYVTRVRLDGGSEDIEHP